MKQFQNIEGKRFGQRVALGKWKRGYGGNTFWLCRCDCGRENWVKLAHLNAGGGLRCKTCTARIGGTTHGASKPMTSAYRAWIGLRARVSSDPSYVRRGVTCCKRWSDFPTFLKDMGDPPEGKQLDRINGYLGYSPSNCRWVTPKENNQNRTIARLVTYKGKTMCVAHWEKALGLRPDQLRKRLDAGLPLEYAMTSKTLRTGRSGNADLREHLSAAGFTQTL